MHACLPVSGNGKVGMSLKIGAGFQYIVNKYFNESVLMIIEMLLK